MGIDEVKMDIDKEHDSIIRFMIDEHWVHMAWNYVDKIVIFYDPSSRISKIEREDTK